MANNAWDPPDPLSNLRRSCSAATLPHSFRTGGSQYNLFNQQPQPQQQQVPDKLLNLYYQGGPQDKKPFSYTADNQLLERELQDAFMRRRRSRPRYIVQQAQKLGTNRQFRNSTSTSSSSNRTIPLIRTSVTSPTLL
uniref:Uncharacterized protein n=1 Tax=Macrostomum lignano TaxID=282301 RepID=A0A1I8JGE8_9PLAT